VRRFLQELFFYVIGLLRYIRLIPACSHDAALLLEKGGSVVILWLSLLLLLFSSSSSSSSSFSFRSEDGDGKCSRQAHQTDADELEICATWSPCEKNFSFSFCLRFYRRLLVSWRANFTSVKFGCVCGTCNLRFRIRAFEHQSCPPSSLSSSFAGTTNSFSCSNRHVFGSVV
jgi:hypothetical protein